MHELGASCGSRAGTDVWADSLAIEAHRRQHQAEDCNWKGALWTHGGWWAGYHCRSGQQQVTPESSTAFGPQGCPAHTLHFPAGLPQAGWHHIRSPEALHLLPEGWCARAAAGCYWRSLHHRLWQKFPVRLPRFPVPARKGCRLCHPCFPIHSKAQKQMQGEVCLGARLFLHPEWGPQEQHEQPVDWVGRNRGQPGRKPNLWLEH